MFFFFFFKQKTAYEMRISDWSSDVCSSDLLPCGSAAQRRQPAGGGAGRPVLCRSAADGRQSLGYLQPDRPPGSHQDQEINSVGRDRKSDVSGKSVSVRVDLGGRRMIKKK